MAVPTAGTKKDNKKRKKDERGMEKLLIGEKNEITLSDVPVEWIPTAHCSLEFFENSLLGKQTSQRRLSGGMVGNDFWSVAECLSTTLMDVPVKLIEGPLHCFLQERTVQDTVNFKVDQEGLKCTVPEVGAHNMIVTRAISGRKASDIDKFWHPVNNLSDECCPRAIVEYCTHFTKNKYPSTRELEDKLTIVTLSSKTPKRRNLRRALIKKDISNRGCPSRFLRSSKSGLQVVEGPGLGQHATLTVLSWLIDNNVILPRQKISYHLKRDRLVKAEGMITREGIKCKCCNKVYSLSKFEAHAGGNSERPANNTFLPDGRSILQCQMQLVHAKKVSDEMLLDPIGRVRGDYSRYNSDNICSVCHYGGELVLCSYCPTSFHLSCIGLQDVCHGQWCCPSCRCSICGQSEYNVDIQCFTPQSILCCDQCDKEYHVGCLVKRGEKKLQNCPWGNWFCSRKCSKIYHFLWKRIGKSKPTCAKGLSWSILRPRNQSSCLRDTSTTETMAEHHSKLWVALSLLHECFVPIVQSRTKRDLFTDVLFNNWSELNRLNFRGFYTVLLERDDEIISVAAIRVHGDKVAEMPLVATHIPYRHQGMCRLLVKEIEKMLYDLGVERLILPAVPQLLETWTTSFGFSKLSHFDRLELLEYTFLDFQDSIMCQKILIPSITKAKKQRGKAEAGDMPTRTNVEMGYKLHDALTNIEPIAMLRSDNLLVCPSHCEAGTNTRMCLDLDIPIRDYEHIKRTETEEQLSLEDCKCKSSVVSGYIDVAAPAGTEQKIGCLNRFRGLSYSRRGKRCSSKEALLENTNERRFKRDTFKYYTRRVARDKSLSWPRSRVNT